MMLSTARERARPDQTRPDQTRPGQTRPGQARPGQARVLQGNRPGQTRPDQSIAREQTGQARPDQTRPGQARPDQSIAREQTDQTLVSSLHGLLNFEIGGIRLLCYYNRVYNTCPLYTHVTPLL